MKFLLFYCLFVLKKMIFTLHKNQFLGKIKEFSIIDEIKQNIPNIKEISAYEETSIIFLDKEQRNISNIIKTFVLLKFSNIKYIINPKL